MINELTANENALIAILIKATKKALTPIKEDGWIFTKEYSVALQEEDLNAMNSILEQIRVDKPKYIPFQTRLERDTKFKEYKERLRTSDSLNINSMTEFIKELEKLNLIELKSNKTQIEKLAHKYLTGQEVKF
jgi:hypothetical protein